MTSVLNWVTKKVNERDPIWWKLIEKLKVNEGIRILEIRTNYPTRSSVALI